jgi:catechol 2,3-dioxygenase-like lactoylglutathione lyase family enzyme
VLISKVHIRLLVGDEERSSAFYEALLGSRVSRRSDTHAVFELDSPPVVLTLEWPIESPRLSPDARDLPAERTSRGAGVGGSARKVRGPPAPARRPTAFMLVVNQPEHVGHAAIALRRAGVRLTLEDQGIEACDPDGNMWRVRFVPSATGRAVVTA